jgi:hypothetical protein
MRRLLLTATLLGLVLGASHVGAEAQTGYTAASLYNLGNSFARAGRPGLAVLNYERARLLAPDDADIEANLRAVREAARLPNDPPGWFRHALTAADAVAIAWLGVIGVLLFGGGLLATRLRWGHRAMGGAAVVVGGALIGLTCANVMLLWPKLHEAVVLTQATPARVSPVPMGETLFVLPEAETVRMTARHEGFVLIRTRTGRAGWVANADLAAVIPGN